MTVLGTRPEIIRLSGVIELLDRHSEHLLVHTGQNFDERLDSIFFEDLRIRRPDLNLGVRGDTFGEQVGQILRAIEAVFLEKRPDRLLILGDTNSGLAAIIARRLGIPVYHMEAGNRCYDDRVPEEVNRRLIDHSSTVLLPYTNRSRANLLREGIDSDRIYVTGNPIKEVIDRYSAEIAQSTVLSQQGIAPKKFFLVTMHRAENVDTPSVLRELHSVLGLLHAEYGFPVVCSLHPRTRSRAEKMGLDLALPGVSFVAPLGFFDFIRLEQAAFCVLSDSGTVQEEACLFGVPNVTLREVTERPETVECGSNYLAGTSAERILAGVTIVTDPGKREWAPPPEYLQANVAETVLRIVTGFRAADSAELARQRS
jgi:UDP-N-acetylglucosamine 2-epimerase (non-hydrolysing)